MLLRRFGAFVCIFAMAVNALAASKPPPMPLGEHFPVEIAAGQQELEVDVSTMGAAVTGAVIGGLVGGLVGSAMANAKVKAAEEAVVPLRDLLIHYDFNQRMASALQAKLPSEGISPDPVFTTLDSTMEVADAAKVAQLPPSALFLAPRYSIDSKFTRLRVEVAAQIVQRELKRDGKLKKTSTFQRTYAFDFPIPNGKPEDNLRAWRELGSNGLSRLLDRGIDQVVDILVYDFSAEGRAGWGKKGPREPVKIKGLTFYGGDAVRETEDYVWIRSGANRQIFEGHSPVDLARLKAVSSTEPVVSPDPAGDPVAASPAGVSRGTAERPAMSTRAADVPASEAPSAATPQASTP